MAVSTEDTCTDPVIANQWYALAALAEISPGVEYRTRLLGWPIEYRTEAAGDPVVRRLDDANRTHALPTRLRYGYLWTTVGRPDGDVFEIPEAGEPDRRTLNAATIGVAVSAPRAIENFLDMGHFPYVHGGVLGEVPHTEVADYNVERRDGELWAVDCRFYQPRAAAASEQGAMTDYVYRVPQPYCAMLYKSAPADDQRLDAIGIFIHPLDEEHLRAHLFLSLLDDVSTDAQIRRFQQGVLSQDKPILENQFPKRLPLDPRAETPIRADKMAIAYRRWLSELGVTYGVIPAEPT